MSVEPSLPERYEALRMVTERLRRLASEPDPLLTPERTELRLRRGQLLAALGQPELAVREFTRGLLADPNYSAYYVERAALHRQLGNLSAAVADEVAANRTARPTAPIAAR